MLVGISQDVNEYSTTALSVIRSHSFHLLCGEREGIECLDPQK
jgi:hypothetical protein